MLVQLDYLVFLAHLVMLVCLTLYSLSRSLHTDSLSILGLAVSSSTRKKNIVFYLHKIGFSRSSWPTGYTR